MAWWTVYFKGGDERQRHEEVFGIEADTKDEAEKEAVRTIRDDFCFADVVIYSIERNDNGA